MVHKAKSGANRAPKTVLTAGVAAMALGLALTSAASAQTAAKTASAAPASQEPLLCPLQPSGSKTPSACAADALARPAPKLLAKPAPKPAPVAAVKPAPKPVVKAAPVTVATATPAPAAKPFVPRPLHARTPPAPVLAAVPKPAPKRPALPVDMQPFEVGALTALMPAEASTRATPGLPSAHEIELAEAASELAGRMASQLVTRTGVHSPAMPEGMPDALAISRVATTTLAAQLKANETATVLAAAGPEPEAQTAWAQDTAKVVATPHETVHAAAAAQAPQMAQVQPQAQTTAGAPVASVANVQARGISSGQDVAALGVDANGAFTVRGLADGLTLSAYDVNMPALIHQILASSDTNGSAPALTAAPPVPPEEATADFNARVALARQLMQVDGSDDLIRNLVNTVHMKLVVGEVNKYLNINSLPEAERYRLSAIVATTAADLSDRILNLNARTQARAMSASELSQLIKDMDIDAQKKLTRMRLSDDGALDKQAELEIQLAQLQIIRAFERR